MARLGIVAAKRYRDHGAPGHPERPERLIAIEDRLRAAGVWQEATQIPAAKATREQIVAVHTAAHVDRVLATRDTAGSFDADTYFNEATADVALLAAGGAIAACRAVMEGTVDRAMALVRPPGHHATRNRAMGFCLFNNVAVAARYLQRECGVGRVAIIDFDVHHGNGTQDIFYDDGNVFFVSLHEYPLWPMSGAAAERGIGAGEGTTLNVPIRAGTQGPEFLEKLDAALAHVATFRPEFLLVSAGFDAHRDDPLANLALRSADFGIITSRLVGLATDIGCRGPVSVLEGGYHLEALAESVEAHLRALWA